MTGPNRNLLILTLLGWCLRVVPSLGSELDYDEGVYYSLAALFVRGVRPYQDMVFVHPPGILYALSPVAWLPPETGWKLARLTMTLVGAFNIFLIGKLSSRLWGARAGCLSALCYAIYPEVASSERRLLLEPLLNSCVLLLLYHRGWKAAWWGACALCIKITGGLWLLTGLIRLRAWAVWCLIFGALLCLPLWAASPQSFWTDVFWFQTHRPPHGHDTALTRLWDIFDPRHLSITLLGLAGLTSASRRYSNPVALQMSLSWLLLVIAYYFAPAHFFQYRAQLAIPECLWAGASLSILLRHRYGAAILLTVPFGFVLALGLGSDAENIQRAETIRALVPTQEAVFAFDPGVLLRAGRLPDHQGNAPVIVDSYATMLIDAGFPQPDVATALATSASRKTIHQRLAASQWLVVDERAREQVSLEWCRAHFRPCYGDLWKAR